MAGDMQQYAQDRIGELLDITGFADIDDVVRDIERMDDDFDGDSYCPYYSQQVEVIDRYEREFGDDAEDFDGGETYKASDWQKAQTAYAYAIANCAFSHYFSEAKRELIEAIEEFRDDVANELKFDGDVKIQVSSSSTHGWASHNRELPDGTMVFESQQLDGCNGMERNINGVWVSCCIDPNAAKDEDGDEL